MEGKVDVLLTWLKKSDKFYIAPNISICESPETGRGIVLSHGSIRKKRYHCISTELQATKFSHYPLSYFKV